MKTLICLLLMPVCIYSQDTLKIKKSPAGIFSLGARSTFNLFDGGHAKNVGTGVGGQFRVQLSKRVNTEWYADYITTNIQNLARQNYLHIGWSVMFYPFKSTLNYKKVVQPYVMMGNCFDYSKATINGRDGESRERYSAAVHAGLGTHFNITQRFDISASMQYMIHLGKDMHVDIDEGKPVIEVHNGVDLVGHVLLTLSLNYKIADMW